MTLTEKQKKILEYIENFIKLYGYPPSIRDICRDFEISSPRGVAKHLESLEKRVTSKGPAFLEEFES